MAWLGYPKGLIKISMSLRHSTTAGLLRSQAVTVNLFLPRRILGIGWLYKTSCPGASSLRLQLNILTGRMTESAIGIVFKNYL